MSTQPSPQHASLVANTVTTLNLGSQRRKVEVLSVDGAAAVYYTIDGSTPSVAGSGSRVIPASLGAWEELTADDVSLPYDTDLIVKLISAGTPKVQVSAK